MSENLLFLENIYKTYNGEDHILKGISFELKKGELAAIRGKSGSGKSTLMNIIGLLDAPTSGTYIFDKNDMCKSRSKDKVRGEKISFIFQSYNLIENYSVLDNILIPLLYSKRKLDKKTMDDVDEILRRLNIYEMKKQKACFLSGGEKQRVAIARAIVKKPNLIIADEPTGNLDNLNAEIIEKIFKNISQMGTSIIVVTHSDTIFKNVDNSYELQQGVLVRKRV